MNDSEYPFPSGTSQIRGKRKTTLGTFIWPIAILSLLGVGVFYIIVHSNDTPKSTTNSWKAGWDVPVNVATAATGDMPIYIDALGTVTPTATVTVRTQISGILQSIAFNEGQMVTKGQFLAQIDPRPYQAALQQTQGALLRDQATLQSAKLDLKRYQTLVAQDSIASQTLDTQAALVKQLEGTVAADQAAVETQKLNLTYAHITAPISGRVGLRQVDAGNTVSPGDSNGIVAITQQSPIDVSFTIPEDQVHLVTQNYAKFSHNGQKMPASVLDRAQTHSLATGELISLDNLIDTTTGTLRAKARFLNADSALFPSQFVNVRLLADTMHNTLIVPTTAILRGQQGLFVYVMDPKGAVHIRPITTGPSANDMTAVLSGISIGDKVVTDGTDQLREGTCVLAPGMKNRPKKKDDKKPDGGLLSLFSDNNLTKQVKGQKKWKQICDAIPANDANAVSTSGDGSSNNSHANGGHGHKHDQSGESSQTKSAPKS